MVDIWGKMLKKMGIKEADLSYEIPFSESSERRIDEFFKEKGIGENIAINFFGSVEDRKINVKNAVTIIKKLTEFLDYSFDQYVNEGKNHFTVAIGCTGGQHRSVSITNYLYDYYNEKYNCFKEHRDRVAFEDGK